MGHTNPAEGQQVGRDNLQSPHLALIMGVGVRNLCCREECQAEMNQGNKHGSERDLLIVLLVLAR
jgi:hypothetical protein